MNICVHFTSWSFDKVLFHPSALDRKEQRCCSFQQCIFGSVLAGFLSQWCWGVFSKNIAGKQSFSACCESFFSEVRFDAAWFFLFYKHHFCLLQEDLAKVLECSKVTALGRVVLFWTVENTDNFTGNKKIKPKNQRNNSQFALKVCTFKDF